MNIFYRQTKRRDLKFQGGFTLVEMLVALGIFAIVSLVAVGALVRIVGLNRQAQSMQAAMNNLSFGLDSMSRDMRFGSNFYCRDYLIGDQTFWSGSGTFPPSTGVLCNSGTLPPNSNYMRVVMFQSSRSVADGLGGRCRLIYSYAFIPKASGAYSIEKAQQSACSDPIQYSSGDDSSFMPLLDETNVTLSDYRFATYFSPPAYAWAFIRLNGYSGVKEKDRKYFDVETVVSQRIHD